MTGAAQDSRTARPPVSRCVVVVPAHNERDGLPDALAAIDRAATRVSVPVQVVVVADACDDGSETVAARHVQVRTVGARNVGAARAAGFLGFPTRSDVWFASTDADSRVPDEWLVSHLRLADAGADAVVGTIVPMDWDHWPHDAAQRFAAQYADRDGHRHIHGANLGVRASVYATLGGFAPLTHDEDVDLVHRLEASTRPIAWSAQAPVFTSTRARGRVPAGFATSLPALLDTSGAVDLGATPSAVAG
ncbi:glycosyltransferase [Williamsia sp. MIQD14]|uniref:glycosyltransferase n=1 Tax=Williamsia sp. MIQD14 TaxID=3425703 RepID=UPI003DA1341B